MRKLISLSLFALVLGSVQAQEIKIGPGIDIVTPISNDLSDIAGAGFGVSARGQVGFVDKFSIMGTVGFQSFSKEAGSRVSMIPAQFGFKYALMDAKVAKFYFSGEAGIHSIKVNPSQGSDLDASVFSYAPGFGVQIQNIDLSAKFQFMGKSDDLQDASTNYFGIRLGYMFGL